MRCSAYRWSFVKFLAFSLLAVAPLSIHAAEAKIGYVDVERISAESTYLKQMLSNIETELEAKRKNIREKEEAYQRLRDELRQKESVMTEAQLDSMRKESRRLLTEIQNDTDDVQRMLRRAEREQMDPAFNLIIETIQAIGREEGFDLVLRGDYVLYGKANLDITEQVIKRLDSRGGNAESGTGARRRSADPESGKSD